MDSINTKNGLYFLHSQYKNGFYLAYREDDNWGRASTKDWAVVNKKMEEIIEYQFRSKYNWREWLSNTIGKYGKRRRLLAE